MGNAWIIAGFVVACLVLVSSAPPRDDGTTPRPPFRTCTGDAHCLPNEFCRMKTGSPICTPCTECEKLHKRVQRFKCAKSWRECGQCLPGYEEVDNSVREKACREVKGLKDSKST